MDEDDSVEKDTVMDVDESSDDESVADILAHLRMQTQSPPPKEPGTEVSQDSGQRPHRKKLKWQVRFNEQVIEVHEETEQQTQEISVEGQEPEADLRSEVAEE